MEDELISTINLAVDYAEEMLEELRLKTGDPDLRRQEGNLGAIIQRATVEAAIPDSVETELHIGEGLENVDIDPLKMRRVIDNLISNSVEAMPEGGELKISANRIEGDIVIRVKDSGTGIPEDLLPNVFKAFVTTKPKGMGLGLSYCRRAVEAHQGSITVESEVGEGTTFTITLPIPRKE